MAEAQRPIRDPDGDRTDFGLGYQALGRLYPGVGRRTFGHTGVGGSIGLANPDLRLGFGYVMNKMASDGAIPLLLATYAAVLTAAG